METTTTAPQTDTHTVFQTYSNLARYDFLRGGYNATEALGFVDLYESQGMAVAIRNDRTQEFIYITSGIF